MRSGFLLYASSAAAMGGLLFGYDTAVIAGTVDYLQQHFQLDDLALGWTVSSALVGCIAGSAAAGFLGDRLGRKGALLACAVLFFASAVWSGIAPSAFQLVLARILGGLGVGAASMLTPVYISEIAPARSRGALTTLNQIAILLGMVAVYVVNAWIAAMGTEEWRIASAWRWMFASEALPATLFFLLLLGIPESPRWLALRGRDREARSLLDRLLGGKDSAAVFGEIVASTRTHGGSFLDCFRSPWRRVVVFGCVLAVFQQFTGINIVMYYAPRIFTSAGLDTTSAIGHSVLIGLAMLVFTCVALVLADRIGRRPLLITSAAGMTLGLAALGQAYAGGGAAESGGWSLLVWVIVYVAAFSIGMGPLVWTIIGEIFPNRIRAHAASLAVLLLWLANYLVSQFFPAMLSWLGATVFWVYAVISLAATAFLVIFLPETKGRSLEELERTWSKP
jgi:SP family arabinose:H+ symporter-like MFS transporter